MYIQVVEKEPVRVRGCVEGTEACGRGKRERARGGKTSTPRYGDGASSKARGRVRMTRELGEWGSDGEKTGGERRKRKPRKPSEAVKESNECHVYLTSDVTSPTAVPKRSAGGEPLYVRATLAPAYLHPPRLGQTPLHSGALACLGLLYFRPSFTRSGMRQIGVALPGARALATCAC